MPIPRRIIQTHRDPAIGAALRETWRAQHPDYEYLFFDDAGCRALVAEQAPHVLATYDALPLAVQKADLFRYIAVHALGGLYTDVDTRCFAPLHSYVDLSQDHLVACTEMLPADWPQGAEDYARHFCMPRQLLQWTFCAPAGHPALAVLIERIRHGVALLSAAELAALSRNVRFTLELAGPHAFTRVLEEFLCGSRAGAVTLLPRRTWGAWPWEHGRPQFAAEIRLRHFFEGTWLHEAGAAPMAQAR